jgi:hypothetical protein
LRRCVYTVLTGGYETLNEQPAAAGRDVPFICLTDDPDLRSDTWEIRRFRPIFPDDPVRSQRAAKMLAHRVLPEFDASLYIDNAVLLRVPPEQIFALAPDAGFALVAHSFRASLLDEFLAVAEQKLDDPARLAEQLGHYRAAFPAQLAAKPAWTGLLLRDHRDSAVAAAMEIWLAHVCRYSRRDQLAAPVAFHLAGLRPEMLAADNHESWFHSWPHAPARKVERRLWPDQPADHALALQIELAQQAVAQAELRARLEGLAHEHAVLLDSTSWRLLEPLRAFGRRIRPHRT